MELYIFLLEFLFLEGCWLLKKEWIVLPVDPAFLFVPGLVHSKRPRVFLGLSVVFFLVVRFVLFFPLYGQ